MDEGELTRIMTTPYGAEATAVYSYTLDNYQYFTAVVMHPYEGKYAGSINHHRSAAPYFIFLVLCLLLVLLLLLSSLLH